MYVDMYVCVCERIFAPSCFLSCFCLIFFFFALIILDTRVMDLRAYGEKIADYENDSEFKIC